MSVNGWMVSLWTGELSRPDTWLQGLATTLPAALKRMTHENYFDADNKILILWPLGQVTNTTWTLCFYIWQKNNSDSTGSSFLFSFYNGGSDVHVLVTGEEVI